MIDAKAHFSRAVAAPKKKPTRQTTAIRYFCARLSRLHWSRVKGQTLLDIDWNLYLPVHQDGDRTHPKFSCHPTTVARLFSWFLENTLVRLQISGWHPATLCQFSNQKIKALGSTVLFCAKHCLWLEFSIGQFLKRKITSISEIVSVFCSFGDCCNSRQEETSTDWAADNSMAKTKRFRWMFTSRQ